MTEPGAAAGKREKWYLAQIKANSFRIAERALRRQSYQVFCPLLDAEQVKAGKSILFKRPLFPGYLFVGFDPFDAPWRAINSTPGVSRLVTLGEDYPRAVPDALVAGLMARCNEDGELLPVEALQPGDLIRIKSGPFAELVSEVDSIGADQRIYMLLNILGRPTRVGLRAGDVDKLS